MAESSTPRNYTGLRVILVVVGIIVGVSAINRGYKSFMSFNRFCEAKATVAIDYYHSFDYNTSAITKDGEKFAYADNSNAETSNNPSSIVHFFEAVDMLDGPAYTDRAFDVSGYVIQVGFDSSNRLHYVVPKVTNNAGIYEIYQNGRLIDTIPQSTDDFSHYFDEDAYEGDEKFPSEMFGSVGYKLERREWMYHRLYLTAGKLKIRVPGEKPTVDIAAYSNGTQKYVAVIDRTLYVCNFKKLSRLGRLISKK